MRPRPWSTFLLVALVALALSAGCGGDELEGTNHGDPVAREPLGPPEDSSPTEVFFDRSPFKGC
jgi:hypothetical protein